MKIEFTAETIENGLAQKLGRRRQDFRLRGSVVRVPGTGRRKGGLAPFFAKIFCCLSAAVRSANCPIDSLAPRNRKARWFQSVVKRRNDLPLQFRSEINEQVAACDQVETRKRRVAYRILSSEYNLFAQRFIYPITAIFLHKETTQPFRPGYPERGFRVKSGAPFIQYRVVEGQWRKPAAAYHERSWPRLR